MTPAPSRREHGIGLAEALVVVALVGMVLVILFDLFRGVTKGDAQVERVARQAIAVGFLRERLAWDLTRSFSPEGLDGTPTVPDPGPRAELLVTTGEVGGKIKTEKVVYQFDPRTRTITRNGQQLPVTDLDEVVFQQKAAVFGVSMKGSGVGGSCSFALPKPHALWGQPRWPCRRDYRPL